MAHTGHFDDAEFVNQYFAKSRVISVRNHKAVSIVQFKSLIRAASAAHRQIVLAQVALRSSSDNMSDEEFTKGLQRIATLRATITEAMTVLNDPSTLTLLKCKLSKRAKSRQRLRRAAAMLQTRKRHEKKDSEARRVQMECRLREIQNEIEAKKKEERDTAELNFVLKDVTKRKMEARKYLSLLNAACKLREAREKSKSGRGEQVSHRDFEIFSSSMEKLKMLWKDALGKYLTEEKELVNVLKKENGNHEEIKKGAVSFGIDDWICVMFGSKDSMPMKRYHYDFESFISMRKRWDQYISRDEGTHPPMGWAIPSSPQDKWKAYMLK